MGLYLLVFVYFVMYCPPLMYFFYFFMLWFLFLFYVCCVLMCTCICMHCPSVISILNHVSLIVIVDYTRFQRKWWQENLQSRRSNVRICKPQGHASSHVEAATHHPSVCMCFEGNRKTKVACFTVRVVPRVLPG